MTCSPNVAFKPSMAQFSSPPPAPPPTPTAPIIWPPTTIGMPPEFVKKLKKVTCRGMPSGSFLSCAARMEVGWRVFSAVCAALLGLCAAAWAAGWEAWIVLPLVGVVTLLWLQVLYFFRDPKRAFVISAAAHSSISE